MPRPLLLRLALLAGALALQSCASQDIGNIAAGDPKQVAVISADSQLSKLLQGSMPIPSPSLVVVIKEVDGVAVGSSTHRVTVAPGMHKVTVECTDGVATNTQFLEIAAGAGAHYQLSPAVSHTASPCDTAVEENDPSAASDSNQCRAPGCLVHWVCLGAV